MKVYQTKIKMTVTVMAIRVARQKQA